MTDRTAYIKEWQANNRDRLKAATARYLLAHPERRKKTLSNPNYAKHRRDYEARNPEKLSAWRKVHAAIRRGELVRPTLCGSCQGGGRIEADHEDYSMPLKVVWLCKQCHVDITIKRRLS